MGSALVAVLWREPLCPAYFTHWDKSAALMVLSILAGMFADPVLIEQTLIELAGEQGVENLPGLGTGSENASAPGIGATATNPINP